MKNPLMSAWLSAANKVANTARGKAMSEVRRAQSAAVKKAIGTGKRPARRK